MKKIVISIAVILTIAGAGMPFVNGMLMEKGFRTLADNINTMYADQGTGINVGIVRYDRGFRTSEVVWKIDLGQMKTVYGIDEIVMVDRGNHGYRGVTVTTSLERNPWYVDFVAGQPDGKDPLTIVTTYALDGAIETHVSLAPLDVTVENKHVVSQNAELTVASDWKLTRIQASGTWQGVKVADHLAMEGLAFNSDLRPISSFIWDGGASVHIGKLSGRDGSGEFSIDGLRGGYTLHYAKERTALDIEASYGVGLFSDGREKVENGSATLGVRNLDAEAYEEAMRRYTELLGDTMAELGSAGDDPEALQNILEQQSNNATLQMLSLAERFLKTGLEIYVSDVHAGLTQGEVQGEALLRLEKDLTMAQLLPVLHQPDQIFDYVSLNAHARLPAVLMGENTVLLEPVSPGMKTGLFVKEGTDLVNRTETREKRLFINNEPFAFN